VRLSATLQCSAVNVVKYSEKSQAISNRNDLNLLHVTGRNSMFNHCKAVRLQKIPRENPCDMGEFAAVVVHYKLFECEREK
jgi:hypothetical protein